MSGEMGALERKNLTKEELVRTLRSIHIDFASDVANYPQGTYTLDMKPLAEMVYRNVDHDIEAMNHAPFAVKMGVAIGFGAGLATAHVLPANQYLELALVTQWMCSGGNYAVKSICSLPSPASKREIEFMRKRLPLYIEHETTRDLASLDKNGVLVVPAPEANYFIEVKSSITEKVMHFKRTARVGTDHRHQRVVGDLRRRLESMIELEPSYVRGALKRAALDYFEPLREKPIGAAN